MPFSYSFVWICLVFAINGVLDLHLYAFTLLAGHGIHYHDAFDKGTQDFCVKLFEIRVPSDMLQEGFEVDCLLLILGEEFVKLCNSQGELLLLRFVGFGELCKSFIADLPLMLSS